MPTATYYGEYRCVNAGQRATSGASRGVTDVSALERVRPWSRALLLQQHNTDKN